MREFRAADWFTITGYGRLAAVAFEDGPPVYVGDQVRIDGDEYEVRGIEKTASSNYVGLLVRRVPAGVGGVNEP